MRLQFRGLAEGARKAFWFKSVTDERQRDFDASVVIGALGCSRAVYAAALGVEVDGIGERWAAAQAGHLAPREVDSASAPGKQGAAGEAMTSSPGGEAAGLWHRPPGRGRGP